MSGVLTEREGDDFDVEEGVGFFGQWGPVQFCF